MNTKGVTISVHFNKNQKMCRHDAVGEDSEDRDDYLVQHHQGIQGV